MIRALLVSGQVALVLAGYHAIRAGIAVFRAVRRLSQSRDFVRLSQHNPSAALMIFMQAPGRERGFLKHSLVGMLLFAAALLLLNLAFRQGS